MLEEPRFVVSGIPFWIVCSSFFIFFQLFIDVVQVMTSDNTTCLWVPDDTSILLITLSDCQQLIVHRVPLVVHWEYVKCWWSLDCTRHTQQIPCGVWRCSEMTMAGQQRPLLEIHNEPLILIHFSGQPQHSIPGLLITCTFSLLGVSSRGRIRKRRIIPNNIEDQGLRKKKKDDHSPSPTPNILQRSRSPAAAAATGGQTQYKTLLNQLQMPGLPGAKG